MVLRARQPLQLSLGPPVLSQLPLDLLQHLLGLTNHQSLLGFDHLLHLSALFLNGSNQLGENPFTLLHHSLCGMLERLKFLIYQESHFFFCVTLCRKNITTSCVWSWSHLHVSYGVSQFLLCILQFLYWLQRSFFEFFLRIKHKHHMGWFLYF